ncbi:MAG: hypothetical protein NWE98_02200 [Candidatus Bathyarchaeota archaeon]|nr:hypothetical protein [Candidatus Bathyarchaeota archaeon]
MEIKISYYGRIEELNKRTDLELVTNSQDTEAIKEYLGGTDKRTKTRRQLKEYALFFVKIEEGEYTEIYASTYSTAWLNAPIDRIEILYPQYEIQGEYGQGWETVTIERDKKEAVKRLKEYNLNESQYPHRLRRVWTT